jgi:aspartyl-tRNA(Asn)/glutamyl-tRNA(Gln) amidotransferase subunit B
MCETGQRIDQETRSFDAVNGSTFTLRSKEKANDYRYFPEPDICPVIVEQSYIEKIRSEMPALPNELHKRFTVDFQLSEYDAGILTENKQIALFFNALSNITSNYKAAANWINGPVKSWLNENGLEIDSFPLKPAAIAELISLIDAGQLNFSIASQRVFPEILKTPEVSAIDIATANNWIQANDSNELQAWIEEAIAKYPGKVDEYKAGKTGLIGLFMGEVMKISKGKADPKTSSQLLKEALDKA